MKVEDIIIALNGKPIKDGDELLSRVSETAVGSSTSITVDREGKKLDLKVKVEDRDEVFKDDPRWARRRKETEVEAKVEGRLREITASVGATTRFAVLLPPTFVRFEPEITRAAGKAGVPVIIPFHAGELPAEMFEQDHFHLNQAGARKFMAVFAGQLKDLIKSF